MKESRALYFTKAELKNIYRALDERAQTVRRIISSWEKVKGHSDQAFRKEQIAKLKKELEVTLYLIKKVDHLSNTQYVGN